MFVIGVACFFKYEQVPGTLLAIQQQASMSYLGKTDAVIHLHGCSYFEILKYRDHTSTVSGCIFFS